MQYVIQAYQNGKLIDEYQASTPSEAKMKATALMKMGYQVKIINMTNRQPPEPERPARQQRSTIRFFSPPKIRF